LHFRREGRINSLKDKKKNYSLTLEAEALWPYLAQLKPQKKRESETAHFVSLRQEYSESDLVRALGYLERFGLPETGKPCHSPMAYLAQAMEQVLSAERIVREQESIREQREREERATAERHRAQLEVEERAVLGREKAFSQAFPTPELELAYLNQIADRYPMFNLRGAALKNLAVTAWWSEQKLAVGEGVVE
jgi:hypothetical protein